MRQAEIIFKGQNAGKLIQHDDGHFSYSYYDAWVNDSRKPSISLSLPKSNREYSSDNLFPFFFNMLPEGDNKQVACRLLKIDESDHFGLLLNTAGYDTIGAVTVHGILEK